MLSSNHFLILPYLLYVMNLFLRILIFFITLLFFYHHSSNIKELILFSLENSRTNNKFELRFMVWHIHKTSERSCMNVRHLKQTRSKRCQQGSLHLEKSLNIIFTLVRRTMLDIRSSNRHLSPS